MLNSFYIKLYREDLTILSVKYKYVKYGREVRKMRDTIITIGAVVACVVAVIGYILAIWSSKKGKQDESIIDWKLFAKLNASSAVAIVIIVITCLVSLIF